MPPFPTPLPNSSVPSWRPFPAAVPDHHPQGFEPPGAQGSGQRCEGLSDSVRPHRRKPTRLPRPWDSPGKNTGVGCHLLLQCMKVKSESEVAQSCLTLSDPMDCSLPGSSIHGFSRQEYWSGVPLPSPLNCMSCLYILEINPLSTP